jgi:uncharacterized protein DUF499
LRAPLAAVERGAWAFDVAKVIGDEPALILLDEMPPFFVSLGAKLAGPTTTEADRLALALANLMNAIVSSRLPNACLVISDLAGAWGEGSLRIQQAIDNANQEVGRGALDITPVRLDSIELYAILRTRLFERVANEPERRAIGHAYAQAFRTAVQQGVIPESYERWIPEIPESCVGPRVRPVARLCSATRLARVAAHIDAALCCGICVLFPISWSLACRARSSGHRPAVSGFTKSSMTASVC